MDGELALKYARSRKTTSDFDRADRQQDLLYAIKEQALNTTFDDNIKYKKRSSLVDNLISEILKDLEQNFDYLISFDCRGKFDFYCKKRRILLINEYTYNQLL